MTAQYPPTSFEIHDTVIGIARLLIEFLEDTEGCYCDFIAPTRCDVCALELMLRDPHDSAFLWKNVAQSLELHLGSENPAHSSHGNYAKLSNVLKRSKQWRELAAKASVQMSISHYGLKRVLQWAREYFTDQILFLSKRKEKSEAEREDSCSVFHNLDVNTLRYDRLITDNELCANLLDTAVENVPQPDACAL